MAIAVVSDARQSVLAAWLRGLILGFAVLTQQLLCQLFWLSQAWFGAHLTLSSTRACLTIRSSALLASYAEVFQS